MKTIPKAKNNFKVGFKVGDALYIDKSLDRLGVEWYSPDIYYVHEIRPPGNGLPELLLVKTINGKELLAHASKFHLDRQRGRDEKLALLGI